MLAASAGSAQLGVVLDIGCTGIQRWHLTPNVRRAPRQCSRPHLGVCKPHRPQCALGVTLDHRVQVGSTPNGHSAPHRTNSVCTAGDCASERQRGLCRCDIGRPLMRAWTLGRRVPGFCAHSVLFVGAGLLFVGKGRAYKFGRYTDVEWVGLYRFVIETSVCCTLHASGDVEACAFENIRNVRIIRELGWQR